MSDSRTTKQNQEKPRGNQATTRKESLQVPDSRPADPRVAALPEWLRLQGATRPDMDPAEAEWCSMLLAAASEIERLRGIIRVNALRWMPGITHEEIDRIIEGRTDAG